MEGKQVITIMKNPFLRKSDKKFYFRGKVSE